MYVCPYLSLFEIEFASYILISVLNNVQQDKLAFTRLQVG
jgi:hypothetical protein